MICAVTPVYKESLEQIAGVVSHLSGLAKVSQIVVAVTRQDPAFPAIKSLVSKLPEKVELSITPQASRARQMNDGADKCRCTHILFLHCDTRLPEKADERIIDALKAKNWGRFDLQFDDQGFMFRVIAWFINKRSRLTKISTGDQAIFSKHDFFQALKGFPDQALMEDVEFCKRASRRASPAYIDSAVITSVRRWQQGGTIRTILLMWWLRGLYWFGVSPERLALVYRQIR